MELEKINIIETINIMVMTLNHLIEVLGTFEMIYRDTI